MQQQALLFDEVPIAEPHQAKKSNVHIEIHDDMHYVYRGTHCITKGYRHLCHAERELALHMMTKHRLVIYTDNIVEAQWSNDVLSEGQWIGCCSDTNYPYEAAWKSSHALHLAKQYFAKYCIEDHELINEIIMPSYLKEALEA